MTIVFDCKECHQRFYTDPDMIPHSEAIHSGMDDPDGYFVDCYICEGCAEKAEWSNAFHDDEAARVEEVG